MTAGLSDADRERCVDCGNPAIDGERCLADGLYPILVGHKDFQSDHDGHEEWDCRGVVHDYVAALIARERKSARDQALDEAAEVAQGWGDMSHRVSADPNRSPSDRIGALHRGNAYLRTAERIRNLRNGLKLLRPHT